MKKGLADLSSECRPPRFTFAAVLLAAGRSRRMGRPKLLLPWLDTTIVGYLFRLWRELGAAQIAVVHAVGDTALCAELERVGHSSADRISNPQPERGMFSSIQCAAKWGGWKPGLTHFAIVPGDQPHVAAQTLKSLLARVPSNPAEICQPAYRGRAAHPVILPRRLFEELAHTGASTLKEFLVGRDIVCCNSDDPGLVLDIDCPRDYARAVTMAEAGRGPKSTTR